MIDPTTNEDLALAAQAGDERAWDTLFLRLYAPLRRSLEFKGWPYHDAEEIASDAFVAVAEDIARFDPERGSFSGLLFTTVGRCAINTLRRRSQQKRGGGQRDLILDTLDNDDVDGPGVWMESHVAGPVEVVMWRETVREAWSLLQVKGSTTQQLTFVAVVQHGDLQDGEIAEIIGTTHAAVVKALHETRTKLAPLLDWQQAQAPPPLDLTPRRLARRAARGATHCGQGHEYTPENTIQMAKGCRKCRTCQQAYMREYDKNRRLAAQQAA